MREKMNGFEFYEGLFMGISASYIFFGILFALFVAALFLTNRL